MSTPVAAIRHGANSLFGEVIPDDGQGGGGFGRQSGDEIVYLPQVAR